MIEHATNHGCALCDGPIFRRQPVESRREERLDGRRRSDALEIHRRATVGGVAGERTPVDEHLEELIKIERVALGCLRDPCADARAKRVGRHQRIDQLECRRRFKWTQRDRGPAAGAADQARVAVQCFGPGWTDEQDRGVLRAVGHRDEQIDEGRLSPVKILDEHDQRPLRSKLLHRTPERPEQLVLRDRSLESHDCREPARDRSRLRHAGDEAVESCADRVGRI